MAKKKDARKKLDISFKEEDLDLLRWVEEEARKRGVKASALVREVLREQKENVRRAYGVPISSKNGKPMIDGGMQLLTPEQYARMLHEKGVLPAEELEKIEAEAKEPVDDSDDEEEDFDLSRPISEQIDRPIHRDIPSFVKWHRFRVPVGNVFTYGVYKLKEEYWPATAERPLHRYSPHPMYYHMAMSRLWWCPPDKIEYVRELARPFTDCGAFKFHVAKDDDTYQGMYPGVIKTPREERRPNGYFTASTKMVVAFVGDRLVWLTLEDPEKAEEILAERSDIPCAIQADALRYSEDEAYRRAFDKANHYFIEYYWHGKPVAIGKFTKSEKEMLEELYDV